MGATFVRQKAGRRDSQQNHASEQDTSCFGSQKTFTERGVLTMCMGEPGTAMHLKSHLLRKPRQEDDQLEASLGSFVRPFPKSTKNAEGRQLLQGTGPVCAGVKRSLGRDLSSCMTFNGHTHCDMQAQPWDLLPPLS